MADSEEVGGNGPAEDTTPHDDGLRVEPEGSESGDWEVRAHELPSLRVEDCRDLNPRGPAKGKVFAKQRGRGAFTYGEGGMYSDYISGARSVSGHCDGREASETCTGDQLLEERGGHVLVFKEFSSKLRLHELEQIVKPYSSRGVSVRFLNDTTALAVFRSAAIAKEALATIHDPRVKVELYSDAVESHALTSEKDLEPPIPRPPTSVRVAERMIAGALSAQGAAIRAKGKSNLDQVHKEETERRQRLQDRQRLRDEAWGEDEF